MFLKKPKHKGDFIMKSEKLVMRFKGDNDIDLATLSDSLNSTVNTLKKLADKLVREDDYCKFRVINIEKGSFVIVIDQLIEYAPSLLPYVPTVISTLKDILEIRKFLKGKPPTGIIKNGNTIEIKDNKGNCYVADEMTINIYTNDIEREQAKIAKIVSSDDTRTGLEYDFVTEDQKETVIEYSKDELKQLSVPQDVEKFDKGIEENIMTTFVDVRKPDLSGDTKWGLTLNGEKISADICDREFLNKVHNDRISFYGNTKMKVEMMVRFRNNDALSKRGTEIVSRQIIKVFGIVVDGTVVDIEKY